MTQPPPALRAKYPRSRYAPRDGCQYCNGTGEVNGKAGLKPCVCIFVSPDMVDHAMKILPAALLETMGIDVTAFEGVGVKSD